MPRTGPPIQDPTNADRLAASVTDALRLARQGAVRSLARLLSWVESDPGRARLISAALAGMPRSATVLGITGPPGVGKSTMTTALVGLLRAQQRTVAVLAVDPSSPFSGGALLGDRVRMLEHAGDPGVYVRSMSARGSLGGLSPATPAAVDLLSAIGFDIVLVETVGVGQSEVDILRLADVVVVVSAPGLGDEVQAAKAGILEIADILVVNKAEREGAAAVLRELRAMVGLGRPAGSPPSRRTPVLPTTALDGSGVPEVLAAIEQHLASAAALRPAHKVARASAGLRALLLAQFAAALQSPAGVAQLDLLSARLAAADADPYPAAEQWWRWLHDNQALPDSDVELPINSSVSDTENDSPRPDPKTET